MRRTTLHPQILVRAKQHTIRQATLAPIATAPAVPPRRALAPAFCMISLKEGVVGGALAALLSELMVSFKSATKNTLSMHVFAQGSSLVERVEYTTNPVA